MCKVLIMPRIKDNTREKALKFVDLMAEAMSAGNSDGLGYAAVDKNGDLFGERWLVNKDFYSKVVEDPIVNKLFGMYSKKNYAASTITKSEYNNFGNGNLYKAVAITLHARMATSGKGHHNTHPFVDQDTSLIHNGVIRNYDVKDLKLSTCDSEAILISYLKHKVAGDLSQIQDMANELVGYYACGVFSRDAKGNRILDVFKANNDNLWASFIPAIDTYVLTTSAHDIRTVCGKLGWEFEEPIQIMDGWAARLDPYTGNVIEQRAFRESVQYVATHSNYSGYETWREDKKKEEKVIPLARQTKKGMSKAMIEYLQLKPEIIPYAERDQQEELSRWSQ